MATSGSVSSSNYEGRYVVVEWTRTSYSETDNTSTISWTLKGAGVGQAGYYTSGNFKVVIDGTTVFSQSTRINLYNGTVVGSGTHVLKHNADGSKSFTISVEAGIYTVAVNCSGSKSFTMDSIARGAVLLTASNFTSNSNPTITYNNPLGNNVSKVEACISFGYYADIPYREISKTGTSYTFVLTENERKTLLNATTELSMRVTFVLRTTYNDTQYHSQLTRTFTISETSVTVNATVTDTNSTTVNLTGDSGKLIKYFSSPLVNVNATSQSGGAISSIEVKNGAFTDTSAPYAFASVEDNVFIVKATDSRGLIGTTTVTPPMIEYIKLTCSYEVSMSATGSATLSFEGNLYNASFGKTSNTLTVQYRYKKSGGSYTSWRSASATKSGNTYYGSTSVSGLDYQAVYEFEVRATDKLMTATAGAQKVNTSPVFDWGADDFNFNVPVTMQEGVSCLGGWTTPNLKSTDIEYGTWMPVSDHINASQAYGVYMRIGDVCVINWCLYGTVKYNNVYFIIKNLPFNADSYYKWQAGGGNLTNVTLPANTHFSGFCIEVVNSETLIYARCLPHGTTSAVQNSQYVQLTSGETAYSSGTICYRIET